MGDSGQRFHTDEFGRRVDGPPPGSGGGSYKRKSSFDDEHPPSKRHRRSDGGRRWDDGRGNMNSGGRRWNEPSGGGGGWGPSHNRQGGGGGRSQYRPPLRADPTLPNKLSYKQFLLTQPDNIGPNRAQNSYKKYTQDWTKHNMYRELDDWVLRRAEDDVLREAYLPGVKEHRKEQVRMEALEFAKILERSVKLGKFDAFSVFQREGSQDSGPGSKDPAEEPGAGAEATGGKAAEEGADADGVVAKALAPEPPTVFFNVLPCFFSRDEIGGCLNAAEEDALRTFDEEPGTKAKMEKLVSSRKLYLSGAASKPTKKFERAAWLAYSPLFCSDEDAEAITNEEAEAFSNAIVAVFREANGRQVVNDHSFRLKGMRHRRQARTFRAFPENSASTEAIGEDTETAVKLANALDKKKGLEGHCNVQSLMTLAINGEGSERSKGLKRLEAALTYLFRVHCFDFYSASHFASNGDAFYRIGNVTYKLTQEIANLEDGAPGGDVASVDRQDRAGRLAELIASLKNEDQAEEKSAAEFREEYEKHYEEYLEGFVKRNTVQEGENRFRCVLPPHKLFRAPEFVKKHINSHHSSTVRKGSDIEWIKKKHRYDPNRYLLMETHMAKKLGLYKQDRDSNGGNGFRAYDANGGGMGGGNTTEGGRKNKRQAPTPPKGHRPDPRASRLVSYNDVDKIDDDDDLVYER